MADFWTRYHQGDSIYPIHPLAVNPALAKLAPSWPSIGEVVTLKLTWRVTYLDPVSKSPTTFLCCLPVTLLVILRLFRVLCVNSLVFVVLGLYWNHYRVIHFWHLFSTGGSIFRGSSEILIAIPSLSFGTGRLLILTWHSMGADGGLAVGRNIWTNFGCINFFWTQKLVYLLKNGI